MKRKLNDKIRQRYFQINIDYITLEVTERNEQLVHEFK